VRCRSQPFGLGPANATLLINGERPPGGDPGTLLMPVGNNMQDKKMTSPQKHRSEFYVELHLVTMPRVVVNAWVRPMNLRETGVLMGYALARFEC
jgi:hypothetical protein